MSYASASSLPLCRFLQESSVDRRRISLSFYSDLVGPAVLRMVDEPVAVNPSRKLARLASEKGWTIQNWGRP
jgi:hypothetical protein